MIPLTNIILEWLAVKILCMSQIQLTKKSTSLTVITLLVAFRPAFRPMDFEPRKLLTTEEQGNDAIWAIVRDQNDRYFIQGYQRNAVSNQYSLFKTIGTADGNEYADWKLTDIDTDAEGNLYVTDSQHQQVLKLDKTSFSGSSATVNLSLNDANRKYYCRHTQWGLESE